MRLIDADVLKEHKFTTQCANGVEIYDVDVVAIANIDNAPTIDSLDLDVYIGGRCCGKRQRLLDELRPKGKWIEENSETGVLGIKYTWFKCSECGWSNSLVIPKNYCPNCGARME